MCRDLEMGAGRKRWRDRLRRETRLGGERGGQREGGKAEGPLQKKKAERSKCRLRGEVKAEGEEEERRASMWLKRNEGESIRGRRNGSRGAREERPHGHRKSGAFQSHAKSSDGVFTPRRCRNRLPSNHCYRQ